MADIRFSNVDKKTLDGQIPVRLCNYTDVYYNQRILDEMPFMDATATAEQVAAFTLRADDVLLTKDSETADDIGVSSLVTADLPGVLCGYHLAIVRPHPPGIHGRYLRWAMASTASRQQLEVAATGVTRFGLRQDSVAGMLIPVPTLDEQRAIADYLDAETARIDAVAARRRRIVQAMQERFRIQADKRIGDKRWALVPLKSVVAYREGPGIMAVDFRDEGTPLLRIGNLIGDTVRLDGCGHVSPAMVRQRWAHMAVHAGELLLSGSATFGLPVIVPAEADGAIPYTGLIRVWPSSSCVEPAYLRLFFGSTVFADQVDRLKTGVAIQHWGPSHLGQVRFPMPPIESQRRLVKELEAEEHALHRLVELGDREIALLIERRQALITAAVTGQIEIPGVAA